MADPINLLESNGVVFNSAVWSATNASLRTSSSLGYQETTLGSGIGKDGLIITSSAAGVVTVISPLFPVDYTKSYGASGIFTIGSAYASQAATLEIQYFTVTIAGGGTAIGAVGEKVVDGAWVASTDIHGVASELPSDATKTYSLGTPLSLAAMKFGFREGSPDHGRKQFWIPSDANYARLVFTIDAATAANQAFVLSDVFAVDLSLLLANVTLDNTYNLLPEYIRNADANPDNASQNHVRMLKKLMSAAFASGIIIGEETRTWNYRRSTDSVINTESKSALTDPQQVHRNNLEWLGQFVGVDLVNPFTGMSMWLSLPGWIESTDSTTWQKIDLIDNEDVAGDSAQWAKVRSASYEDVQSYRDQVNYAFNGLNAGQPYWMREYLKTTLDTTVPDNYFHRIKTHDRESPVMVKYVYDTEVDPDPDGTRVSVEMDPTLSMGVLGSQSGKPRDAGVFAFEAKDVLAGAIPGAGAVANDDTVLRFGNDACAAIPDVTGSGRHLSLLSSTTAIDTKDSRYGIIAGARYNTGFAFYPSGVTGSKVFMRAEAVTNGLTGGETEADYLFLISDINYGNSSDIILLEQGTSGNANYRACVIDESGVLKYLTGASGSAASSAYVSGTHTALYDFTTLGLRWIRFSVSASTTKFYVAPSLVDVCHPTSYLINSVSLSTPNVYDKTLTADIFRVDHGENGIVGYRAIVNDGPLDSSYAGLWG